MKLKELAWLLAKNDIQPQETWLYICLLNNSFTNNVRTFIFFKNQSRIMEGLKIPKSTYFRHIKTFSDNGVIYKLERKDTKRKIYVVRGSCEQDYIKTINVLKTSKTLKFENIGWYVKCLGFLQCLISDKTKTSISSSNDETFELLNKLKYKYHNNIEKFKIDCEFFDDVNGVNSGLLELVGL